MDAEQFVAFAGEGGGGGKNAYSQNYALYLLKVSEDTAAKCITSEGSCSTCRLFRWDKSLLASATVTLTFMPPAKT